mmetsp:Transcript_143926/g.358826  ORF Transcript_143926/g.358826 Transcript_143926/m.358826 type:complete len:87 (-) Transcript_143926:659-919(-)
MRTTARVKERDPRRLHVCILVFSNANVYIRTTRLYKIMRVSRREFTSSTKSARITFVLTTLLLRNVFTALWIKMYLNKAAATAATV